MNIPRRRRAAALVALLAVALGVAACSGPAAPVALVTPSPPVASGSPAPTALALPPPSLHPSYPPNSLADLVALADRGVPRKFLGMEGQPVNSCTRAWMRVYIPDGTPPEQAAADLLRVALARHALDKSCGGFVYGTTHTAFCNCYVGDHGLVEIERGPELEPAPGKMRVTFFVTDNGDAPGDWVLTVDAPTY